MNHRHQPAQPITQSSRVSKLRGGLVVIRPAKSVTEWRQAAPVRRDYWLGLGRLVPPNILADGLRAHEPDRQNVRERTHP